MQRGSSAAAECMKLPNGLCLLLVMSKKAQRRREAPTWLQESLLTIKRKPEFALTDRQLAKCARVCAERNAKVEVSRVGKRLQMWQAAGRAHEWVCGWKGGGGGCGKEAGRVERNSLSLVRILLRWNKPRLRNDIFSHPSNKLYIQQISGPLPNHFFPPQSLKSCIW